MKEYRLYWRDGSQETVYGETISHAMNSAGIGGGALRALDYWEEIVYPELVDENLKVTEE